MNKKTNDKGQFIKNNINIFHTNYIKNKSGCWNWTGDLDSYGYGRICINYKSIKAHRLSWKIFRHEINQKQWVLHKCDNRKCVNPDHLFLGDSKINTIDMVIKNRQAKGEKISNSKLTEQDVIYIRKQYKFRTKGRDQIALAKLFGVNRRNIEAILKNKIWKHI